MEASEIEDGFQSDKDTCFLNNTGEAVNPS